MKNKLIAFLVSKAGGVLTPLIAMAVAAVVSKLAMVDQGLADSVDQVSLTGFIVALIISIVNYVTNETQVNGVKKIQSLVKTDEDGVAGPITYTEVRRAIAIKKPAAKRKRK